MAKKKVIRIVPIAENVPITKEGKPKPRKPLKRKDIQEIFFEDEKRTLEIQQKRLFRSKKLENRIKRRARELFQVRGGLDRIVLDIRTGRQMKVRDILKRKIREQHQKQNEIRKEILILENDIRQFKELLKREKRAKFKKKLQDLGLLPTKRSEDDE